MDGAVLAHHFVGFQHCADLIQVPTLPNGLLDADLRGKQQRWAALEWYGERSKWIYGLGRDQVMFYDCNSKKMVQKNLNHHECDSLICSKMQ